MKILLVNYEFLIVNYELLVHSLSITYELKLSKLFFTFYLDEIYHTELSK